MKASPKCPMEGCKNPVMYPYKACKPCHIDLVRIELMPLLQKATKILYVGNLTSMDAFGWKFNK